MILSEISTQTSFSPFLTQELRVSLLSPVALIHPQPSGFVAVACLLRNPQRIRYDVGAILPRRFLVKVEGSHKDQSSHSREVLLVISVIVISTVVICSRIRKPDPAWASTYSCIEASHKWDNPVNCTLFEESYTLELREDGTLTVEWSESNCSHMHMPDPLAQYRLPSKSRATGKWWSRRDNLLMELTLPLRVEYTETATGVTVLRTGLPMQVTLKGERTLLSRPQEPASSNMLENRAAPWRVVLFSDAPGFVFQDGSKWVELEEP